MQHDRERPEPSPAQPGIRLGNGLILLNLLDCILVFVIIFSPSNVLRIILVIPFLLFFPGYALITAIFPGKEEIGGVERVVLSSGLSIVVVSLIGLILNFTPWGIRLKPILYSVASLILMASVIAWLRQSGLTEHERFGIRLHLTFLGWGKNIKDRVLTITLVLAILGALCTLIYITATPKGGEAFTEFYILGQQGKSGDYPDKLKVGDEGGVIVGIINHERMKVSYSIEGAIGGNTTSVVGPVVLVDEQKWEGQVGFVAREPGEDQKVEFGLYKNGEKEPYLELHLWVDVAE
jgi:uncharacterized membrane protein